MPIAAVTSSVTRRSTREASRVPEGAQVGVRWDSILLDPVPAALSPPASRPPPHAARVARLRVRQPAATAPPDAAGPRPRRRRPTRPRSTSSCPSSWARS